MRSNFRIIKRAGNFIALIFHTINVDAWWPNDYNHEKQIQGIELKSHVTLSMFVIGKLFRV